MPRPNLVFVFADQMRAAATGYSGNAGVQTPNLDRLASQGLNFSHAISGIPVCTPWRASMLTGQYPLTHGLFLNDLRLPTDRPTFGTVLKEAGYGTAYIGKWHLDGPNRGGFTPPGPRRQGFDFWAVGNCTHDYGHSLYYRDTPEPLYWEGYDASAQTGLALEYFRSRGREPFALFLSWGPPHDPYGQAPLQYKERYPLDQVPVRPNCPAPDRSALQGYHAHVTALDEQVGRLLRGLEANGQLRRTVFVFTSDHGDMLGSQGEVHKQRPWEESIHVPFLIRAPMMFAAGRRVEALLNVWDLMPTLLRLLECPVPGTVEGRDLSAAVRGEPFEAPAAALAGMPATFADYHHAQPWRAVRTRRHTYARNLDGPWLLYDNAQDPYQMKNLVKRPQHAALQATLEAELQRLLRRFHDDFQPGEEYLRRWGYTVQADGALGYHHERPGQDEG